MQDSVVTKIVFPLRRRKSKRWNTIAKLEKFKLVGKENGELATSSVVLNATNTMKNSGRRKKMTMVTNAIVFKYFNQGKDFRYK